MDSTDLDSAQRVCGVDDLEDGGTVVTDVDGTTVAVFCVEGDFYVLDNVCPHQGGPIGEGKVEDGCVYCPWHGWQFDLETGSHVHGKADATVYPVVVEDGAVYVSI